MLAAAATLVALAIPLVVEGALRRWRPTPCPSAAVSEVMACLHTYSDVYGWTLRPGIELAIPQGRITIDGDGRRRSRSHRPGGRTRVVSLGDSVAFGLDVDDEATLAAQLRALDPGLDVIDLSVPGYGTDQELLRLEGEGLPLAPAVVLLNFCLANDLADNALPAFLYDGVHPKPYYRLAGGALRLHAEHLRLAPAARAAMWLSEHSVLFNLISPGRAGRVLAERAGAADTVHWQTRYNEVMADPEPLVALAARLIEEMKSRGEAAGARLVVVSHPPRRFHEGAASIEGDLRQRLGASAVRLVSLGERYRTRGLVLSDLMTDGVGHLNARGHRAAAEAIRNVLAEAASGVSLSSPPPE
jgi:hypothetical protein